MKAEIVDTNRLALDRILFTVRGPSLSSVSTLAMQLELQKTASEKHGFHRPAIDPVAGAVRPVQPKEEGKPDVMYERIWTVTDGP